MLSSHAADGHQMNFGGSVVGKASTIGREISPTPPLIFTGGQKVRKIWHRLKHHSTLSCPCCKMHKISKFWKKSAMLRWLPYVLAKFGEASWVHPSLRKLCQLWPTP